MLQIAIYVLVAGTLYWLGGIPALLICIGATIVWCAPRRRRQGEPPAVAASVSEAFGGGSYPLRMPPDAIVFASGTCVPPPDPNSITYLAAVALLRGNQDAALRVYEAMPSDNV